MRVGRMHNYCAGIELLGVKVTRTVIRLYQLIFRLDHLNRSRKRYCAVPCNTLELGLQPINAYQGADHVRTNNFSKKDNEYRVSAAFLRVGKLNWSKQNLLSLVRRYSCQVDSDSKKWDTV